MPCNIRIEQISLIYYSASFSIWAVSIKQKERNKRKKKASFSQFINKEKSGKMARKKSLCLPHLPSFQDKICVSKSMLPHSYSPFHLKRAASRSDRLLLATWAKTAAPSWLAAVDPIWTLLLFNETGFHVRCHSEQCRNPMEAEYQISIWNFSMEKLLFTASENGLSEAAKVAPNSFLSSKWNLTSWHLLLPCKVVRDVDFAVISKMLVHLLLDMSNYSNGSHALYSKTDLQ